MEIVGEPYHEYNYDVLNILNKLVILWLYDFIEKLVDSNQISVFLGRNNENDNMDRNQAFRLNCFSIY